MGSVPLYFHDHDPDRTGDPPLAQILRDLAGFYRRRWRLIASVALACFVAVLLIATGLAPRYTATAQVLIERPSATPLGGDAAAGPAPYESAFIDSQVSVLRSTLLLQRVVRDEALLDDPEFSARAAPSIPARLTDAARRAGAALGLAEPPAAPAAETEAAQTTRAVRRLQRALSVGRIGGAHVVRISVTAAAPDKAARIANAVARAYIGDHLDQRRDQSTQAADWLESRLATLQAQLRQAEDAVESFRADNDLLTTPSGSLGEQQLAALNLRYVDTRTELAEKRAMLRQIDGLRAAGDDLQAHPLVQGAPVIAELRAQLAEVRRREDELLARYGAQHPLVIGVRAERRTIETEIAAEVTRVVATLTTEIGSAEAREAALDAALSEASGTVGADNRVGVELRELERVAASSRSLYEGFLDRARIMTEETAATASGIRVISAAVPPEAPSFPPTKILLLFGLLAGLVAGSAAALPGELLQPGFATRQQAERGLGLPVLAAVPLVTRPEVPLLANPEAPSGDRPSEAGFRESLQSLRHALLPPSEISRTPVIQVTSALPGEGKTTLAIGMAASAATAGYRVLLVDADLRSAGLTRHFGMAASPGLVDLLTHVAVFDILLDDATGAYVMPCGAETRHPADILGSARMQQFVDWARASFDLVLIDGAPVCGMADAGILQRYADTTAFVVKWRSSPQALVDRALRGLDRTKLRGVVMNMVEQEIAESYGDGYDRYPARDGATAPGVRHG